MSTHDRLRSGDVARRTLIAQKQQRTSQPRESIAPGSPRAAGQTARANALFGRLCVAFDRRAGADQVPVAMDIIHTPYGGPVFVPPETAGRKTP